MKIITLAAGFAAGIFFVVACERAGTPAAHAAPSDCAAWQYANASALDTTVVLSSTVAAAELPSGWEPFAVDAQAGVLVRRCKP
ncbi:MAG TPA: hypothetical protein VHB97_21665 [Polyangia bacterium]|jgi:hypothetical protein|nr:hypothetical protein [Polyangia bacterium]